MEEKVRFCLMKSRSNEKQWAAQRGAIKKKNFTSLAQGTLEQPSRHITNARGNVCGDFEGLISCQGDQPK